MSIHDSTTLLCKSGHCCPLLKMCLCTFSAPLLQCASWKTALFCSSRLAYYPVVTIPAGARSIEVQELQLSSSHLAVRSLGQKYYLTGGWNIDWPGEFPFAGTVFEYQRTFNHPERLYAPGPTNETLVFEVSPFCLFSALCLLLHLQ